MRIKLLLFFALILGYQGFGQSFRGSGDTLDLANYPADSFTVRKKAYKLGRTKVILSTVSYDYLGADNQFFNLWVEQWRGKRLLHSKSLGMNEDVVGYILPARQNIRGFFIIGHEQDFRFTTYLISKEGSWYILPGVSEVVLDKASNTLYSYAPVENGPHRIGKFAINTRTLSTKYWNGYGLAWAEIKDEKTVSLLFENGEPISWETVKTFPRIPRH